jgi:5-methylcytosine-specific restriction endonuclease McrA
MAPGFFGTLSDQDLLVEVNHLVARERRATGDVIAALMEVDKRRLYLAEGCASLFIYCTHVLHLSEHAAYGRIQAARAARRIPSIIPLLIDGSLTLTAVTLLGPHLTADSQEALLASARHKSRRHIELLVARLRPQPDVPPSVRKIRAAVPSDGTPGSVPRVELESSAGAESGVVPQSTGDSPAGSGSPEPNGPTARDAADGRPPRANSGAAPVNHPTCHSGSAGAASTISPLSAERFKVQMTIGRETWDKLRQVQDLLRHALPAGDPASIFDRALTLLLADLRRTKTGSTEQPRRQSVTPPGSRYIPMSVRRQVWSRDGGRCGFVGASGRCNETGFLEFHHRIPYAEGGETTGENLELRCRAHNLYEAEQCFGTTIPLLAREAIVSYG